MSGIPSTQPSVAYILAVLPHDAWTSRLLVEIAVKSWPDQRFFIPLRGVRPGRDWDEGEHVPLRKAGVMTAPVVEGNVYFSGITCGISTALFSNRTSREAGRILRCVTYCAQNSYFLENELISVAKCNGRTWPKWPAVRVLFESFHDRYGFCFREQVSGATLVI